MFRKNKEKIKDKNRKNRLNRLDKQKRKGK